MLPSPRSLPHARFPMRRSQRWSLMGRRLTTEGAPGIQPWGKRREKAKVAGWETELQCNPQEASTGGWKARIRLGVLIASEGGREGWAFRPPWWPSHWRWATWENVALAGGALLSWEEEINCIPERGYHHLASFWPLNLGLLIPCQELGHLFCPIRGSCCPTAGPSYEAKQRSGKELCKANRPRCFWICSLHLFRKSTYCLRGIYQFLGSQGMREFTKGAEKSCCDSGPDSYILSHRWDLQPHQRLQLIGYNSKVTRLTTHQRQTL